MSVDGGKFGELAKYEATATAVAKVADEVSMGDARVIADQNLGNVGFASDACEARKSVCLISLDTLGTLRQILGCTQTSSQSWSYSRVSSLFLSVCTTA